jgi:hypothetical protein
MLNVISSKYYIVMQSISSFDVPTSFFSILRQNYNLNKKHIKSYCTNVKMKENLHFPLVLSIQHHARNFVSINGTFRNLNLKLVTIVMRKAIGKENSP